MLVFKNIKFNSLATSTDLENIPAHFLESMFIVKISTKISYQF